jgi:pimeloyl-ACP methyl ester carboxylesterase
MRYFRPLVLALFVTACPGLAQEAAPWHDPSPHKVQFVAVDKDVELEVLDWGGTGRPIVLLAGLGNTAHEFDDFALKLTSECHVYGITRRGYGTSSSPVPNKANYSADRLGDDVLAVLDVLKLERPVLVGHSLAGEELSSIGSRHPERVAGLIYLDAGFEYAFVPAGGNSLTFDIGDLQNALKRFQEEKPRAEQNKLIQEMLQRELPAFETDLRGLKQSFDAAPAEPKSGPGPAAEDRVSFQAFRSWMMRDQGFAAPESELRLQRETRPDGGVGKAIDRSAVASAISAGEQKYSEIRAPVLAIFANPRKPGPYPYNTAAERAAAVKWEADGIDGVAKSFAAGIPNSRVVQIAQANHYVFLSNEADVLREMRDFIEKLK